MSIIYLSKYAAYPSKWKVGEIVLIILIFITVFHLPSHFVASSRIAIKKQKKDGLLIKIDKYMLGWLIKDGQISLWIDKNKYIGPQTVLGMFLNNALQISYFFYYLIPYVTMYFINLLNCLREIIFRYQNNGFKSATYKKNWNNTLFLFSVYLLTCVFVLFINTLLPAASPRKYLENQFSHPLVLSGLPGYLNKKCKDEKSANSFPSGHVAEILSIGLSYLGAKEYGIGLIVIFNAVLIALATLFLRYHYFCDIIMAIFLAFLSFELNYFFGYKKYLNYKKKDREPKFKKVKILNPINEYEYMKI
jgi:membrane-associated phospholipid phosphatase